jgi:putative ABC transport system ATP-binding protein
MNYILESKELNKSYTISKSNKNHVLKNINLKVNKGEFVSVMGPSGSGKSTLLYNISGMDRMTSGEVTFNGKNLSSLSEKELSGMRLKNMGFIFQHIHLLKNLSIFDNIILTAYLAKEKNRKEVNKKAEELLEKTGIAELAPNDITMGSGGQLQRVGICRALINDPEIIFGDEPTGALNSKAAGEIMELLADINNSGTTIFLVTHDIRVAARTERVLFMLDGKITAEKVLGKCPADNSHIKSREEALTGWLAQMGF